MCPPATGAPGRAGSSRGGVALQRSGAHAQQTGCPARRAVDEGALPGGRCDADLVLKWTTEVSSAIYATPLITDLYSDGARDIVVPSFVHYMEVRRPPAPAAPRACRRCSHPAQVVEAADGAKATHDSWPAFHKSTVHTAPLLHDWDFDGVPDILVATYDGEVLAFKDTVRPQAAGGGAGRPAAGGLAVQTAGPAQGEQLLERLAVPRLRVRKDWWQGLAADPTDHSRPDAGTHADAQAGFVGEGKVQRSAACCKTCCPGRHAFASPQITSLTWQPCWQESNSVEDLVWRRRLLQDVEHAAPADPTNATAGR